MLTEIGVKHHSNPPILWNDNLGAQALACNPVYHARTKHIELDVHFVRNLVSDHQLEVRYVPTEAQPADLFTKALPTDRFHSHCSKLTIESSMCSLRGCVGEGHVNITGATDTVNFVFANHV